MPIHVTPDPDALAVAAARFAARRLTDADGPVTLGLAGGSTPDATYARMRHLDVPWMGVTAWMTDERWVPLHHDDSNEAMAREVLFDHVPARIVGPDYGDHGAVEAAAHYEAFLSGLWRSHPGGDGPDVVFLGMGDDGHTASLFPDDSALDVGDRDYIATYVDSKESWRLTATRRLLRRAGVIVFLVSGTGKAEAVRRVLADREPLPAGLVAKEAREVHWFLDEDAAAGLE